MTIFKTLKELEDFKDESMFCVCGRLMTGLHMEGCGKLRKMEMRLREKERLEKQTEVTTK